MPRTYEMELAQTAYKLVNDQIKIKKGESVLITIDSIADFKVAEEIAKMAGVLGAKVMVAWHTTPVGYGEVTVPYLPEPLIECADKTDVWIELNNQWLLYSPMWSKAVTNGRTRQIMLGGLSIEQMVRCIGKVDIEEQKKFQDKVCQLTSNAKKVRITNEAGTDVSFENDSKTRPVSSELMYDTPGAHFLLGQIGWAPVEETINGKIVFDGAISGGGEAEIGLLKESVTYNVENGRITSIEGGSEADIVRKWLKDLDDPNMYIAAHVCYGFSPFAKLEGTMCEDERIWGSTEWGFGYQSPGFRYDGVAREAKSHIDGTCLKSSVYLDGELITKDGEVIHKELVELAKKVGR